ncbi:MAG: hypothetical protein Q8O22_01840, partial [Candidatus Omnitrophota bacterium]|nr:hypothetical protein [Candidatus Omnitrophota bacterium]
NLFFLKPLLERKSRGFMADGGPVFSRASRFLEDGGILDKFMEIENAGGAGSFDDFEVEDILGERDIKNKKFLDEMDEYFRDSS